MVLARLTETDLPPDVFAVVMATGIVSVAAHDNHYPRIGIPLAVVAVAAYVLLALGLAVRVVARPASAVGEIRDPDVALRMFTASAAGAVLAARFATHPVLLRLFGGLALGAWLVLVPLAVLDVARRPRTELRDHAHGAWLLPSVATAGLATTAADLAVRTGSVALVDVGALAWLLAVGVYLAVASLIAWRAVAAPFVPDAVTPDSWILMGALAVTTLAGAQLLRAGRSVGAQPWLVHTLAPATRSTWIVASLWIPVLLYAEVWRVDRRAGSLHYAGVWWSAVFPLGMYSAATHATSVQLHLRSLTTISLVLFWIAFTVWILVATGWVHGTVWPTGRYPAGSGHDRSTR